MSCPYCGELVSDICIANKRTLLTLAKEIPLSPEMLEFLKKHGEKDA